MEIIQDHYDKVETKITEEKQTLENTLDNSKNTNN